MNLETVIYEVKENIAKITMNRPEKRNALNHQILADLDAAFEEADRDTEVRVVILTGTGKAFSAGYDLGGSPYTSVPEGYDQWTTGNALSTLRGISDRYLKIVKLSKPVIAQVHGFCMAAGCYLQMCCDMAIAAEDAVLGHPLGNGGVTSMPLWIWFLGPRKAKEMLFTNKLISGTEAERIGLVNKAVPADQLEEEVWKTARQMAEANPDGLAILKEAINADTEMMGLGALFTYHRQLNALGRVGRTAGYSLTMEDIKARREKQQ